MKKKQSLPRKGSKLHRLSELFKSNIQVTAMDIIELVPTTTPHSLLHGLRKRHGFNIVCELVINPDGSRYGIFTLVSGGIKNDYS